MKTDKLTITYDCNDKDNPVLMIWRAYPSSDIELLKTFYGSEAIAMYMLLSQK